MSESLCRPQHARKLGYCQCCFLQSHGWTKKVQLRGLWTTKAQDRHKDGFPVTLSFMQQSDIYTGHLSDQTSFLCVKLRVIVFLSVWCVLAWSLNLFTLLERSTHIFIWLIKNYMYLTRMSFFSPLSLFLSHFGYQTNYKKENSMEVWTVDAQSWTENNLFKKSANFKIILGLSLPELSG